MLCQKRNSTAVAVVHGGDVAFSALELVLCPSRATTSVSQRCCGTLPEKRTISPPTAAYLLLIEFCFLSLLGFYTKVDKRQTSTKTSNNLPRRTTSSYSTTVLLTYPPSQEITSVQGYLRGHGTYVEEGTNGGPPRLLACVAGVVERVNKLISVRPIKTRCESFRPPSRYIRAVRTWSESSWLSLLRSDFLLQIRLLACLLAREQLFFGLGCCFDGAPEGWSMATTASLGGRHVLGSCGSVPPSGRGERRELANSHRRGQRRVGAPHAALSV